MIRRLYNRCLPLFTNRGFRNLLFLNMLLGLTSSFVAPFSSMFGTMEVGMSPLRFGLFMMMTATGGVVIGTTLAHYSDTHYSRRSMLLLGSLAGMVGFIGYAFLRDFVPLLLVGTFILGISSITFSQLFAHAREMLTRSGIPAAETAFYMNAFRMFLALSWTIGPALASWIMVVFKFRGLFLSAAAVNLCFAAAVYVLVPDAPPPGRKGAAGTSMLRLLGRWDVLAHFTAFVLIFTSGTIGMMNLPLLVMNHLGGDTRNVGIIYSIAPVFELPFMLYFGLLAMRHKATGIIRVGFTISTVYYGLLCLVRAPEHVYPLQILGAAATAVSAGVAITYFQNFLPDHPGSATNLYANATRIGATLGYLLFGTIADHFGNRAVFVACTSFALIALLLMQVPVRSQAASAQAESV
jgi:SET family sugar efflux transporter-like MFS transporter